MTNTDYFKTFCKISKAFGTTLKKGELLEIILQSAIDTMGGKAACIFLNTDDPEEDIFVPVAQKGLSENYLHAAPMNARKVVGDILKGGYLAIRDAASDERAENHAAKKAEGIASMLVVPIMVRNKAIGVLSLYTATPRDFSEEEAEFLSALAEQGGMAIQNSRLFERINKNSDLFYEMSSSINSSLDIKKIMHIMSASICEAFGMKGVSIRLYNPESDTMDLMASYGLSEKFLNKGPISPEKSETVAKILEGETIYIRDAATDPRFQYGEEAKNEGIKSMLCIPIMSREEVIGEMRLCSGVEREFSEDVVKLVEALADQGGIAIQNASMYLMLQEDKKDLEKEVWSHRQWF
jgi:GAF domain-containing protein